MYYYLKLIYLLFKTSRIIISESWDQQGCFGFQDQLELVQNAIAILPEDEAPPLFDELGEGVDPTDLDMSMALSASTTKVGKKGRGVSSLTTFSLPTVFKKNVHNAAVCERRQ